LIIPPPVGGIAVVTVGTRGARGQRGGLAATISAVATITVVPAARSLLAIVAGRPSNGNLAVGRVLEGCTGNDRVLRARVFHGRIGSVELDFRQKGQITVQVRAQVGVVSNTGRATCNLVTARRRLPGGGPNAIAQVVKARTSRTPPDSSLTGEVCLLDSSELVSLVIQVLVGLQHTELGRQGIDRRRNIDRLRRRRRRDIDSRTTVQGTPVPAKEASVVIVVSTDDTDVTVGVEVRVGWVRKAEKHQKCCKEQPDR